MGNKKSSIATQTSTHSKNTAPRRRINVQMAQNVLLIWLDSKVDAKNADYRNSITKLRETVNDINIFTNGEECIQFIEDINDNKACMIVSGSLGQHIVPCIHDMSQLDSIFIFCRNAKFHEGWAKDWPKVKGIFTQISPICEALKQVAEQCEQNAIPISFVATSGDVSKQNLNQLDPIFMYSQILKEILLTIAFNEEHITDYIDYCRDVFADNERELKNIDEMQKTYHDRSPIWWYTCECFLYPMLNRALRLMDMDIIIKMGFFINDLRQHIWRLHSEQFKSDNFHPIFIVYRGQGMSKIDFDHMTKTQGGLMSFNNFLSTSRNRDISLIFARRVLPNSDMVGLLFVMTIDPAQSTTSFASISNVSYYKDKEDEILFSMNTVFHIEEIKPMNENKRLFQVNLTLTRSNNKALRALTDQIQEETFPHEKGWQRLALLLNKLGHSEKAEEVNEILLAQTTSDSEKGMLYERLGVAKRSQGEYQKALEYYKKSLRLRQQSIFPNPLDLAASYNNIGNAYYNLNDYTRALKYYKKALRIRKESLPPNHSDFAVSYNNIGMVYDNMNEYSEALHCYQKAVKICQQSLSSNHPDLAASYSNIGNMYYNTNDYSKALLYYEKAFNMKQQSLPSDHPELAMSYNNMGLVYENMGDYSKAQSFYERAVGIGQHSLSPNHPDLHTYQENLDDVKKKTI